MKTLNEIAEWCEGAAQQLGDPSIPVGQVFAKYVGDEPEAGPEIVAMWSQAKNAVLVAMLGYWVPVPISTEGPLEDESGKLVAFGIEQICPGVWSISPSLNMPGVVHVFVTIYDVPVPAPWERRIILLSDLRDK